MARTLLVGALIALACVLLGCENINSGKAQILPSSAAMPFASKAKLQLENATETDLIEQVAINRQAYGAGLERLVEYYTRTGNHMKLRWAKKELHAFETMPKYDYIIEASIAGPNLKPTDSIPEADFLFREALQIEKTAGPLNIFRDENLLRLALAKYNQLIRRYPTSDKIDDAAYRAGLIYDYFKDYNLAVLYFRRVYQWDPQTRYPAAYREALILDKKLHRRDEALEAYKRALDSAEKMQIREKWVEEVRQRIKELTKSDQKAK